MGNEAYQIHINDQQNEVMEFPETICHALRMEWSLIELHSSHTVCDWSDLYHLTHLICLGQHFVELSKNQLANKHWLQQLLQSVHPCFDTTHRAVRAASGSEILASLLISPCSPPVNPAATIKAMSGTQGCCWIADYMKVESSRPKNEPRCLMYFAFKLRDSKESQWCYYNPAWYIWWKKKVFY